MFASLPPSSFWQGLRHNLRQTFEVAAYPLHIFHLLCLVGGPLATLTYLVWLICYDDRPLLSMLATLLVASSPWHAVLLLGMVYSVFIWGVYVLPKVLLRSDAALRRPRRRPVGHRRLRHAFLWGLTFGPLFQQYVREGVLPWPLNGIVLIGLIGAFCVIVRHEGPSSARRAPPKLRF